MESLKSVHVTNRKINNEEQMNEKPRKQTENKENARRRLEFTVSVNDLSMTLKYRLVEWIKSKT